MIFRSSISARLEGALAAPFELRGLRARSETNIRAGSLRQDSRVSSNQQGILSQETTVEGMKEISPGRNMQFNPYGSFRTFQKQPAWRGQRIEGQLRRFMGSADRRKIRYARLLVDALDLAQVPRPLDRVLAHV